MTRKLVALCLLATCWVPALPAAETAAAGSAPTADLLDWTYWRGPEFNNISRETGIVDKFNLRGGEGSNVAWKRADLGGRSTPIVMHGRLYTILRAEPETTREQERVVCVNAVTGDTIWESRHNVALSDVPDTRVGWSSVAGDPETDYVYALGVNGLFQCLEGATGKRVWSVPLHEQFGLLSTYGGRTNFPLVFEDLVIISGVTTGWGDVARPAHRFFGFDKRSGTLRWCSSTRLLPEDTTYSSPVLALLAGERAFVVGAGDGSVWAFQPRTGQALWQFPFSRRGLNSSPVVAGGTVFMGQGEENLVGTSMGAVVAFDGTARGNLGAAETRWREDELLMGATTPLVIDDRLYCFDDQAKLHVFDAASGERIGKRIPLGTAMESTPLFVDGKIYAFLQSQRYYILEPDEQRGARILTRGEIPSGEDCQASPICSHGRLYVLTTGALYCLMDPSKQAGYAPGPPPAAEPAVSEDDPPAQVQVVPAELLTKPGAKHEFQARLFNARGQLLRESAAEFSLDGPGQISSAGLFEAAPDAAHTGTIVRAKVGNLEGSARVRVVPDLPWQFGFDGLKEPPASWIGARYRHVVRNIDGNDVMVKVTTIPKGTRSRSWFGPSDLHDYTIQADVKGDIRDGKMPDIGLIAQGYTLDLQGVAQKLQIRMWDSQLLRMGTTVDFRWDANRWYTLKFQVSRQNDQALTRGKVWPAGEPEPEAWSIEAVDEAPNVAGSPGLFGNSTNAEIFLDNLRVFANE